LAREYRRAVAGRASPPCGKVAGMFVHHNNAEAAAADARRLVCYDCGIACDLGQMREERLVFLRKLGAERPSPPPAVVALPVVVAEPAKPDETVTEAGLVLDAPEAVKPPVPKKKRRQTPESRRPRREGGTPVGFRIRFAKVGPAALLGHLDLARELPRTMRRALLRVRYSEGFHPKPDLSFAPALSLGVASLDEYVDTKLIDAPPAAELLDRLSRAAPPGLRFLDVVPLAPGDPAVSTVVTAARYVVAIADAELASFGGMAGLSALVARFLELGELKLRRDVGGIGKMVDVRSFVRELKLGDERSVALLYEAGIVGRVVPLEVTIAISQSGSAKVAEVIQALTDRTDVEHLSVRTALLADGGTPLDLARFRKVKPEAKPPLELELVLS
jgi:radical SAM-linked protein